MTVKNHKPRIGLVIGSGGLKCAASIGLWDVFQREGIEIDLAVGCSGGSIFASLIALGWEAEKIEQQAISMWTNTVAGRIYYRSLLKILFPRFLNFDERFGLIDDRPVMKAFHDLFGEITFEQTKIPLYLAATDLHTGHQIVVNHGQIKDGIRASMAIPIVFRPWVIDGQTLIDGGASDPLPVGVAVKEGCDIIIAMGFETPMIPQVKSVTNIVNQSFILVINNLLRSTYAFTSLAHHSEVIPILPEFERPIQLTDAHLIPYLIEQGRQATEEQLAYLHRLMAM